MVRRQHGFHISRPGRNSQVERFVERGTTIPLKPLLRGHNTSSLSELRAPLGGFAVLVGIQNSERLTRQRSGKIDGLPTARFRPIDHSRPLHF